MIIFKESTALAKYLAKQKEMGLATGFVPTMGALHKGHTSLISLSKKITDLTVCSIFVNPTQFNNPDDFKKYPITLAADIKELEQAGCDVLFIPSVREMYASGFEASSKYELGEIEFLLEGAHRPGHFQGVCQVVEQLLGIVEPGTLFLGQKDYQQTLVIQRMIVLKRITVEVIVAPTVRLASGVAMSSRNMRLSKAQLEEAASIYKMLTFIKEQILTIPLKQLEDHATKYLLNHDFDSVDYVSIVSAKTLEPIETFNKDQKKVALMAATIGGVRLIDNLLIE